MAKRPIPFWDEDWERDEWVQNAYARHDYERIGVYIRLLVWCKQRGSIDGEPALLALELGLRRMRFDRLWDDGQATGIRWKFVGVQTGTPGGEPGERLYNRKMKRALDAQDAMFKPRLNPAQFEYRAAKPARRHRSTRFRLHEEQKRKNYY